MPAVAVESLNEQGAAERGGLPRHNVRAQCATMGGHPYHAKDDTARRCVVGCGAGAIAAAAQSCAQVHDLAGRCEGGRARGAAAGPRLCACVSCVQRAKLPSTYTRTHARTDGRSTFPVASEAHDAMAAPLEPKARARSAAAPVLGESSEFMTKQRMASVLLEKPYVQRAHPPGGASSLRLECGWRGLR